MPYLRELSVICPDAASAYPFWMIAFLTSSSKVFHPRSPLKVNFILDTCRSCFRRPNKREKYPNHMEFRFRLTGIPPEQAIKTVDIDVSEKVKNAKRRVRSAYCLNPILTLQFIVKGAVVSDSFVFGHLGLNPTKDVVTVMATQAGGI